MKHKLTHHLLAALLGVGFTTTLHAQLVADGGTRILTTATNTHLRCAILVCSIDRNQSGS